MGAYDSIGIPIGGQPISSGNFGIKVRDAIIDLDNRVAAIASARVDRVKSANETRTSTTTYALDTELQGMPLDEGEWEITAVLAAIGGAGGIAIKTQWDFSGTWDNPLRFTDGPTAGNTVAGNAWVNTQRSAYATNSDAVYGLATSGFYTTWREYTKQVTVTVAGLMALKWAPNVSSASSGGIRQGSSITAIQIG